MKIILKSVCMIFCISPLFVIMSVFNFEVPVTYGASGHYSKGPVDPGVRGGDPGAGGPIDGLTNDELNSFNMGLQTFQEVVSVSGTLNGEPGRGLGPRFNGNSCVMCHQQPAIGGTSPFVNPQIALATLDGARNRIPFFIKLNGPAREARFKTDSQVHNLFTITGRADAPGCYIRQPDFAAEAAKNNLSFRIASPVFGGGLIQAIEDKTIIENQKTNYATKLALGIQGYPNRSDNDGTISRFGWKAQNKSVMLFVGEAYNVEMGVTDDLFSDERDNTPGCLFNALPEDSTGIVNGVVELSDDELFTAFIRLLAPPAPAPDTPSIANGREVFKSIGCALCHTPSLMTGSADIAALRNRKANLYSDLLLHDMGELLKDGITQGKADGYHFRTAPLWGLGQRIFFLHDGRTRDLVEVLYHHGGKGSEAYNVMRNYYRLSPPQQQDLYNFLRSL